MQANEPIPSKLSEAATRYATDRDTEEVGLWLFEAFGITAVGDAAHRRAAWLCVLAVRRILDAWSAFRCEGRAPEVAVEAVAEWARGGTTPADWLPLCKEAPAIRDGRLVTDCDENRVGPVARSAANAACFALTAEPKYGAEVLFEVWAADFHGIHALGAMPIEKWVADIALPAAWELRELSDAELLA